MKVSVSAVQLDVLNFLLDFLFDLTSLELMRFFLASQRNLDAGLNDSALFHVCVFVYKTNTVDVTP